MALDSFANHRQLRPTFGGAASSRIQRIEEAVDRLWRFCENLSGEDGISIRETAEGGAAIGGGGGGGSVAVPENMAFLAEARTREENGADVVEVKMRGGTAQGLFGGIQVFNTTYWTPNARAPELFDDYDDNCDDVESADISDGELFWLEYDPEANAGEHWTIEHDTSLPQSAVAESDEESVHYFSFVTLFRVRLTESGKGVVQNHFGAVVVPTATNVVDVQTVESGSEGEGEGGGE